MIIQDPSTGQAVGVSSEGKLEAVAVCRSGQEHVNNDEGEAFSVLIDATTIAVDDQFFYLKNDGDKNIHITSIKGFVSADTEIKVLIGVTGTATGPATVVPVNRNGGSGSLLDATVQEGADLQLTGGRVLDLFEILAASTSLFKLSWESHIVLPKNSTIVFESSAASIINLTVSVFAHEE